jgi:hypothetical protein
LPRAEVVQPHGTALPPDTLPIIKLWREVAIATEPNAISIKEVFDLDGGDHDPNTLSVITYCRSIGEDTR